MAVAIDDLLDNCAQIKAGQEVVLGGAHRWIYMRRQPVDAQAIAWIQGGRTEPWG